MDLILLHTIIMKRFMIFSYFCVSLLHVCHIHGEIFSSVYKLSIISKEEGKLLSAFNKYISTQARDQKPISFELQRLFNDLEPIVTEFSHINFRLLNDLEPIVTESFYINFRLLNDLEPIVTESSQDPRYAEHPINAFHLIGRFVYKWPVVYSSILCEDCVLDKATAEHSEVLNANEQNDINEEEEADISFVRKEYDDNYVSCRENRKTPKESSKLYCYLSDTVIPYYKGKVEIANLQPKIFLFHDVISDREALYLRNEGSKEAWLHDKPGIVKRATHRVGLLTGLKTKSSPLLSNTEPFQIVNYGIGGMYNPHYDTFEKPLWGPISEDEPDDLRGTGDRIATWLFYLNDVKVGGATVFPNINTRIPVIQKLVTTSGYAKPLTLETRVRSTAVIVL
ncbi:P4HA [Mytilus edulis]|uniref:P4HA n=1 Tax=Mytilus edulis TaxID=6550 RepID=A0A8S3Q173_MYTED|nr:P4HA [Mytilus edulis]